MSDVSQGPGWWIASDGRWYPPHLHPSVRLSEDTAAGATGNGPILVATVIGPTAVAPGPPPLPRPGPGTRPWPS